MAFIRIGDKLIDKERIDEAVNELLRLRSDGDSQQEAANRIGVDRTFVSRLEGLGEVRKGGRIALIGFPVSNKEELASLAKEYGVDLTMLMTEKERWEYLESQSGADLFNSIMRLIYRLQNFRSIIFIGSDMRINLMKSIMRSQVIGIFIGKSPLREDKHVEADKVKKILEEIRN